MRSALLALALTFTAGTAAAQVPIIDRLERMLTPQREAPRRAPRRAEPVPPRAEAVPVPTPRPDAASAVAEEPAKSRASAVLGDEPEGPPAEGTSERAAQAAVPEARPSGTAPAEPPEPADTAPVSATAEPSRDPSVPPPLASVPEPEPRPGGDAAPETESPSAPAAPKESTAPPEPDNSTEALKSRVPEITPAAAVEAAAAIEDAKVCEAELEERGVAFTVEESISEGECGVLRPVSVTRLSSGVAVSPKTQMLCRTALALDRWMSDGVVPAAKKEFPSEKLAEFRHASTYVCRPRASENGISEHARGSAIDIAGFVFEGGREIGIEAQPPGSPEERFQAAMRGSACGPFRTVLGPGTDADHATHFHLDIAARRSGATYCK